MCATSTGHVHNYTGHHLYSNLPALPHKSSKLLTDHFTAEFIEERRADLEVYLQKLAVVPHVAENPDFLDFLDLKLDESALAQHLQQQREQQLAATSTSSSSSSGTATSNLAVSCIL
jgi:PX domain